MKNIKIGNTKKLLSVLAAGFVLLTGPKCKANTEYANSDLNSRGIKYESVDSTSTNMIINAENVLRDTITNGFIEEQYQSLVINETLLLNSVNQMRENILNYNITNLFNNRDNYSYLSMGIYLDNENERNILLSIADLVQRYSLNPNDTELLGRLINIFAGNDQELITSLLSVGGKQALANDVYYVNALVQVFEITDYQEVMNNISYSFGDNGDIITFIQAIKGENCITR